MDFDRILDHAIEMLQRRGRLTYRTLKRQFELDDEALEDPASGPERPRTPIRDLLSYTPRYLTDKILTSPSALEGERKQVTVLFADIKGSTAIDTGAIRIAVSSEVG